MTTKITKRDRYVAIIDVLKSVSGVDTTLIDFCQNEIDLLEKKATKAKETAAAKKNEADPLADAVRAALATLGADDYATIAEVTDMVADGDADVTKQKVAYRLSQLVKAEVAVSTDIKVPATETTKAKTVKGYRLA